MTMKVLAAVLCVLGTSSAFAQGVKVKKAMDASKAKMEETLKKMNTTCGTHITYKLDKSFEADEDAANKASWCSATLDGIDTLCRDADYKAAIAKDVKSVTCKLDKALTKDKNYGNAFDLKGGALSHSFSADSFNHADKVNEFLKSKM